PQLLLTETRKTCRRYVSTRLHSVERQFSHLKKRCRMKTVLGFCAAVFVLCASASIYGQLIDKNRAPNTANEGITRPLTGTPYPSQVGNGRTSTDPNSSLNVIAFDPFRAIRRGRQLFQRKFGRIDGQGPLEGDGFGNINTNLIIGAGLADSCAACHGRPRGSAGV